MSRTFFQNTRCHRHFGPMYQLLTQNQGWYVRRNRLSLFSPCSWIESRASVGDGAHRPNIVRMEILDRARGVIDLRDRGRTDGINVTVVTIIQQQRDRPVRIPHKLLRRCTNSSRLTQTIAVAAEISLPPPLVQNGSVDWAEFRVPALKLGTDLFVRRGQEVWRCEALQVFCRSYAGCGARLRVA